MVFVHKYQPYIRDFLNGGKFSLQSLLDIMEDCGNRHSQSLGEDLIENGRLGRNWIVAEWAVSVERLPVFGEELTVKTWVRGKAPAVSIFRAFSITAENGDRIAAAEAKIALFDFKAGKLVKIDPALFSFYGPEDIVAFVPQGKLRESPAYDRAFCASVSLSDMDYNGHLHNTCYLRYALDALSEEEFRQSEFQTVRIAYKKPILPEDGIAVKRRVERGRIQIGLYSGETLCSLIELSGGGEAL